MHLLAGTALLVLVGCSRASLLGGPGPEVAYHPSPAETERLAVLEEVRKFKTKDACKAHLASLAHGAELVEVSAKEVRAYHSAGGVHHEYSCTDKLLLERSWKAGDPVVHAAAHSDGVDDHAEPAHEADHEANHEGGTDHAAPEDQPH
jgi:hypothetical protein